MSLELVRPEEDEWKRFDELSAEAFPDATLSALADEVWALNLEIGKLKGRRNHLEAVVLQRLKQSESGEVYAPKAGKTAYLQDWLAEIKQNGEPVWKWKLEWSR